jgi:ABC-type multidrug transport system, ATPase and permease components
MNKIIPYLKPYFGRMSLGLIIKFTGTIMDLLLPWILAYIIDNIIPTGEFNKVLLWGFLMLVCSVLAVSANIIANRMAAYVGKQAMTNIRHDMYSKVVYLSNTQLDKMGIPSLISRLTTDTYNVHDMIVKVQRLGVRAPILLLGGIIITITLEPVLTLLLIAVMPFVFTTVYIISKLGIVKYGNQQLVSDHLIRVVRENISGIRVIKALSKMEYEKKRFKKVNEDMYGAEFDAAKTMAVSNPLMNIFLNIGLTLVILAGAYRVNEGLTQIGTIIAFLSYFTIILNAMLSITKIFILSSKGIASANRVGAILDMEEDLKVMSPDIINSDFHIEFNNVKFAYNKNKKESSNVLDNINFKLKKGETLGIIGATGSGKSTIIKLLLRLYDVDSGTIRINGADIRGIESEVLHTMFGVVFQNDFLFADTISENIRFERIFTNEEIETAAKHAQAAPFIEEVKARYEYQLTTKGSNLSGGQKQRILLSRALCGNPSILILDDSSSALDYKTDANLRKSIRNNYKDTTSIIIAQRISSVMHTDHIMVIENGRILGYGTHAQLIKTCDVYKEIEESQLGGAGNEW